MSKAMLSREEIVDLLYFLGASVVRDDGVSRDIQFTCTVHKESNPSAGIRAEDGIYNCFACHSSGNLAWLVYQSEPDLFPNLYSAYQFLEDRYGLKNYGKKQNDSDPKAIRRYERVITIQPKEEEKILRRTVLAPFKSGKETYKLFFDRGFTRETMIEFNVGRNLQRETITMPIYNKNDELVGIIERFIDPNRPKNARYGVSKDFDRGKYLFPENKFRADKGYVILVEGTLDAPYLHQLGYDNTLALMNNKVSKAQAKKLLEIGLPIIAFIDNDSGGEYALDSIRKQLTGLPIYTVEYINGKNDPQECTLEEIEHMLRNKKSARITTIKRR